MRHGLGKVKSDGRCYKSTWAWPAVERLCGIFAQDRICSLVSVKLLAQAEFLEPLLLAHCRAAGSRRGERHTVLGRQWLPDSPLRDFVPRFHIRHPPLVPI